MKKGSIFAFAAILLSGFLISGCTPAEQSTYTEKIYRIGTVYSYPEQNKAGLIPDKTTDIQETIYLKNFNRPSHLSEFGINDGDRVLATMELTAKGIYENNTVELLDLTKINVQKLEQVKPADSLNYYYNFTTSLLGSTSYPAIWNAGHIVNVSPVFFIPEDAPDPKFYFYPVEVLSDTLVVRLYSYIPKDDVSLNPDYTQTFLNCDISSLASPVSDPMEQARRDVMLNSLRFQELDYIQVRIVTPDTLRALNSKNVSNPNYIQPVPGLSHTVQIPFDF